MSMNALDPSRCRLLYLIRHGQTTGDVENRYGGSYDDHLTDLGRRQSHSVAQSLIGTQLTMVYSSPLSRARETADIVATALKAPQKVLPAFRECNRYGILSGMSKSDALRAHPEEVARLADLHKTVTGAEPYSEFRRRVTEAFDSLGRGNPSGSIALITHGGVFRVLFREILGLGEASIDDCALARLEFDGSGFRPLDLRGITLREPGTGRRDRLEASS
jgi:broad specificity phosphatase PhoE